MCFNIMIHKKKNAKNYVNDLTFEREKRKGILISENIQHGHLIR